MTSATNPESGTVSYQYDNNGNLTGKTDARPVTTTITYDALNRPVTKTYAGGVSTPQVNYFYDQQTLPSGAPSYNRGFARGRLVAVTYNGGSTGDYYGYDELGRANIKYQRINTTNYSIQATYNKAGGMTGETYPSGRTVSYGYDNAGRLTSFSGTLGDGFSRTYATITQYNPAGQKERESYGTGANGMTTPLYLKLHYNRRQQMVDLRLGSVNDEWDLNRGALTFYYGTNGAINGNPFQDDTDNNGNVLRQWSYAPKPGGGTVTPQLDDYTYDSLNRVATFTEGQINESGTLVQNVVTQNFAYDQFGNRRVTSATGGVSSYNPTYNTANNRINGLGYDNVGNITSDPATGGTMTYDAENRMLTATSGGGGTYVYDGEGKRVKRTLAGGQEWWYVYGIGGELLAEHLSTAPTTVKKECGYRGGQLLVVWNADEPAADKKLKWLVMDHLGSTRMEADKSGSLAGMTRHDYAPFGEEMYAGIRRNGSGQGQYGYEPPQSNVRQKFTGKERDSETGLDYFGFRYHSSVQGRFTSPDEPLLDQWEDDPQSWNLYSYVRNNPLRLVDPTGQAADSDIDNAKKKKCLDNGACYNPKTQQYEINGNENGRTTINATIRPDLDNEISEIAQQQLRIQLQMEFFSEIYEPAPSGMGAIGKSAMKRGGILGALKNARKKASGILAANMRAKGVVGPPGTVAHHIVGFGHRLADRSRRILRRHNIDINAAENGVFMNTPYHQSLTNNYYLEVERLLLSARNKGEVITVLKYIADGVSKGTFPR